MQNTQSKRSKYFILCILLLLVSFTEGCSFVSTTTPDGIADHTAVKPTAEPFWPSPERNHILFEDSGPQAGGTLRLFMVPSGSLDPLVSMNPYVRDYGWFVYDPLIRINDRGMVEPVLAERLHSSQDGKIWDVYLHQDILFHDHTLLSANDVVFSLLHARNAGVNSPYGTSLANLSAAEALSRDHVRLILTEPDALFTQKLWLPILPEHSWSESIDHKSDSLTPIGTGAYSYKKQDDDGLYLVRNENWWKTLQTGSSVTIWPAEIVFVFGFGESDRTLFFQQRKIDATWTQMSDKSIYENRKDLETKSYQGTQVEWLAMGNKNSSIKQPEIEKMMMQYLIECLAEDGITNTTTMVDSKKKDPTDLAEKYKPMLESLGCKYKKSGDSLTFLTFPGLNSWKQASVNIHYSTMNINRLKSAEWIEEKLLLIGIKSYILDVKQAELLQIALSGKFDFILIGTDSPSQTAEIKNDQAIKDRISKQVSFSEIMPLYREQSAMLYSIRIRGEKTPSSNEVYGGWESWYLVDTNQ